MQNHERFALSRLKECMLNVVVNNVELLTLIQWTMKNRTKTPIHVFSNLGSRVSKPILVRLELAEDSLSRQRRSCVQRRELRSLFARKNQLILFLQTSEIRLALFLRSNALSHFLD